MAVTIRERLKPRYIEFYGDELTFAPAAGTYWITPTDFVTALRVNVAYGSDLYAEIIECCAVPCFVSVPEYRPPIIELPGQDRKARPHLSVGDAVDIASNNSLHTWADVKRLEAFIALLKALQIQATTLPIHAHTLAPHNGPLRDALEKNPDWAGVLRLRNQGKTEGEIAKELSLKVTKVRSALLSLEKKGFDLLKGDDLTLQRDHNGGAIHIPAVTPIPTAENCLKFRQKDS